MIEKIKSSRKEKNTSQRKELTPRERLLAGVVLSFGIPGIIGTAHLLVGDHDKPAPRPSATAEAFPTTEEYDKKVTSDVEKLATERYICRLADVEDLQTTASPEEYDGREPNMTIDGPRGKVNITIKVNENPEVADILKITEGNPIDWHDSAVRTREIKPNPKNPDELITTYAPMYSSSHDVIEGETNLTLFPKQKLEVGTMTGIYIVNRALTNIKDNSTRLDVTGEQFCGAMRLTETADGVKVWKKIEEPLAIKHPAVQRDYQEFRPAVTIPVNE